MTGLLNREFESFSTKLRTPTGNPTLSHRTPNSLPKNRNPTPTRQNRPTPCQTACGGYYLVSSISIWEPEICRQIGDQPTPTSSKGLMIEGSAGTTAGPGASIEDDDSISPPCASGRRRSRTSPSACGSFRSRRGTSPAWRATLRSLRPAGTPPGVPSGARRSSPTRRVRAG